MPRTMPTKKNLVLFGLLVVGAGVILHAYQLVIEWRIIEQTRPFLTHLFPARLQVFLLLSLLLTAAGLAIGTRWALGCSILGLLGVLLGHIRWWHYSRRYLQLFAENPFYADHPEFIPPNSFGLIGATWWDIVLLVLFVTLLIWEVMTLVKMSSNQIKQERSI